MHGFEVQTHERSVFVDITSQVAGAAASSGVRDGVVVVYVPHTTAGVTINENADPSVRVDMRAALDRLVPESPLFTHLEGNADAHVKASLIGSSVMVPLQDGNLQLGTWQGVYFAEFDGPRRRRVSVSVLAAPQAVRALP
jgi:secondary thiamine-phosphate synthase enzyme